MRERIVKVREAAEASFAVGEFELVTERVSDGGIVQTSSSQPRPVSKRRSAGAPDAGRVRPRLDICRACDGYFADDESACPHCGADLAAAAAGYEQELLQRTAAIAEMEPQLAAIEAADPGGADARAVL